MLVWALKSLYADAEQTGESCAQTSKDPRRFISDWKHDAVKIHLHASAPI